MVSLLKKINKFLSYVVSEICNPGTKLLELNQDFFIIDREEGKEYLVDTYWDIREKIYHFTGDVNLSTELADNLYYQNLNPTKLVVYKEDSIIPPSVDLALSKKADHRTEVVMCNSFFANIIFFKDNNKLVICLKG